MAEEKVVSHWRIALVDGGWRRLLQHEWWEVQIVAQHGMTVRCSVDEECHDIEIAASDLERIRQVWTASAPKPAG
jgi:hypothetical protein